MSYTVFPSELTHTNPRRPDFVLSNAIKPRGLEPFQFPTKIGTLSVLQNDIANKSRPVTIVAAISSKFDNLLYPTEVLISAKARTGLAVDSVVNRPGFPGDSNS